MAARYTSGAKFAAYEAEAAAFASLLEQAAQDCLHSADADALAYNALTSARKNKDAEAISQATTDAIAVPAELLARCAQHAAGLVGFMKQCNPYLLSDVKVGIHLLCGAGRAAWQTLLINQPDQATIRIANAHLAALASAEQSALRNESCAS
jgi:formiminotetrahydrofolate cyclodeaminase